MMEKAHDEVSDTWCTSKNGTYSNFSVTMIAQSLEQQHNKEHKFTDEEFATSCQQEEESNINLPIGCSIHRRVIPLMLWWWHNSFRRKITTNISRLAQQKNRHNKRTA